jgi:hypothetical protein
MAPISSARVSTQPLQKNTSVRRPITSSNSSVTTHQSSADQINHLQRSYGNRAVQRLIQRSQASSLDRLPTGLAGGAVNESVQRQIDLARGGGQPLDKGTGTQIGAALGANFSDVHVHTNSQADQLNRSLNATAFTTGSDIFFSQGAYQPGTPGGQQLLAHELTHVVQQGGSKSNKVQAKFTVGPANDKFEQEADQVAVSIRQGANKPSTGLAQSSGGIGTLQRKPKWFKKKSEEVNSVNGYLHPLSERGRKRFEYHGHITRLAQNLGKHLLGLEDNQEEALRAYLDALSTLFNLTVLSDAYKDTYGNKKGETDFGPVTNSLSRWVNKAGFKYGENRNWDKKKGLKKAGGAIKSGVYRAGTVLSGSMLYPLAMIKTGRSLRNSDAYKNVKRTYDTMKTLLGGDLDRRYRPMTMLMMAMKGTLAHAAGSMDVKTIFEKWRDKREGGELQEYMNQRQLETENTENDNAQNQVDPNLTDDFDD